MKALAKLIGMGFVIFVLIQFIRPGIPNGAEGVEVQAPPEVKRVLDKSCYSCHSNRARLAWFDQVVPGYWMVRHDVLEAREHLNFSTLGSKPAAAQRAALFQAVNMVQLGAMPLPAFRRLHSEAAIAPEEIATIKSYLHPWGAAPNQASNVPEGTSSNAAHEAVPTEGRLLVSLAKVRAELNSFPFDPHFENWKLLSTTDRGDNNTLRFILGNDIGFEAARNGNISPWPKGAKFAKIAWEQKLGADGLIHPGKFVQVELMQKDAAAYRDTEGWGWGRWRGLDLQPYGKTATFVRECTGCHKPMQGDDYVYTLPITGALAHGQEIVNNRAALPTSLPYQPLSWHPVTMYIDPQNHTMATLYADQAAAREALSHSAADSNISMPRYLAGTLLALVTWIQRDDPHWFGGRIPDYPERVEFWRISTSGSATEYRVFQGHDLVEGHTDANTATQRTAAVLALAPAQLP